MIIDDGRADYLDRCLDSFDSESFDDHVRIIDADHELGFAGAIDAAWQRALATGCDHIFHVEGDFTFNERPDIAGMKRILGRRPLLAQVALKRQPWNERECAAGGIVEADPGDFADVEAGGDRWCEHRRFFTTNPSLYPREIAEKGWPQVPQSEGVFTHRLLAEGYHFAYYGAKFDRPRVHHIGAERAGHSY